MFVWYNIQLDLHIYFLVGLEPEIKSIPSLFPYPQSQGEGSKFWVYMGLTYMKLL